MVAAQHRPAPFHASSRPGSTVPSEIDGLYLPWGDTLLIVITRVKLQVPDSLEGTELRVVVAGTQACRGGLPNVGTRPVASFVSWPLAAPETVITDTLSLRVAAQSLGAHACELHLELYGGAGHIWSILLADELVRF